MTAVYQNLEQLLASFRDPISIAPSDLSTQRGYKFTVPGGMGRALLSSKNGGVHLIYRLKDTRPLLEDEIVFWGEMLAALAPEGINLVSHAPSSGKVPDSEHLATLLAQACARKLDKPFFSVFVNQHPRGNRGSRVAKLYEASQNPYLYMGPANGSHVLVVDDVVFTRSTATRCVNAVTKSGDSCALTVLYKA